MSPGHAHLPVQAVWWISASVLSVWFKYIKSEMELILFTLISGHKGANGKEREAAATSSTATNQHRSPGATELANVLGDVTLLPVWVWPWLVERHRPPGPWSCSIHTQRSLHLWPTEWGGAWVGAGDLGLKTRKRTLIQKSRRVVCEWSLVTEEEGAGWTGEQGKVVEMQEKVQTDSPVLRLRFCLQLTETLKTNTFDFLEPWTFFGKHKTMWGSIMMSWRPLKRDLSVHYYVTKRFTSSVQVKPV